MTSVVRTVSGTTWASAPSASNVVVALVGKDNTTSTAVAPTFTGLAGTWTLLGQAKDNQSEGFYSALAMFVCLNPDGSGTVCSSVAYGTSTPNIIMFEIADMDETPSVVTTTANSNGGNTNTYTGATATPNAIGDLLICGFFTNSGSLTSTTFLNNTWALNVDTGSFQGYSQGATNTSAQRITRNNGEGFRYASVAGVFRTLPLTPSPLRPKVIPRGRASSLRSAF